MKNYTFNIQHTDQDLKLYSVYKRKDNAYVCVLINLSLELAEKVTELLNTK